MKGEPTPRPWVQSGSLIYSTGERPANICALSEPRATGHVGYTELRLGSPDAQEAYANGGLIVQAVNDYDALLAEVQRLRAQVELEHNNWELATQEATRLRELLAEEQVWSAKLERDRERARAALAQPRPCG